MIYVVRLEQDALDQLAAIEDYIAKREGSHVASNYTSRILGACNDLATFPHRGRARDDIRPGLRITGYQRRITIAFTVDDVAQLVTVVGLFYGGRDWETHLS